LTLQGAVEHIDDVVVAGSAAVGTTGSRLDFAERAATIVDHPVDGAFGHGIADAYVHAAMIHE
jgi:hypothetical protein